MEKNNTQKGIVQFAMEAGAYMGLYFVVKFIFAVLSLNYPFCNVVSTNMTSDPSLLEAVKTGLEQGNIPSPMAVVIQQMWVNVFFGSLLSAVMAWLVSVWFKSSKTKK